jgi:tetratricopeptide (TPR) repeat protein
MKAVKYLLLGVLSIGMSAPVMAQSDNKATIDAISKVIKSKQADAADQVKDVFKKNKKNAEVMVGIARAYYEVKDTANAIDYANKAIKVNKNYAPAYELLGDVEQLRNDGGAAASWYQQAIYFDPKSPDAYIKYASVYRKISPSEAIAKLEELRTQRPDISVDALEGRIQYASNNLTEAVKCFAKADKSKLEERDIWEHATSLYLLQRNQEALDVAKYGLTVNPRSATFNRLAMFNSTELKDYTSALQYADALFNKSDSAKFSYFDVVYYGNALKGDKQYDKALEQYQKALSMDIDDKDKRAGVYKEISDAYKNMEDYDNAIKNYREYMNGLDKVAATDYVGLGQMYIQRADKLTGDARTAAFREAEGVYDELQTKFEDAEDYALLWKARINSYIDPETKDGLAKPSYEKLVSIITARPELDKTDRTRLLEAYRYLGYYYLLQNNKEVSDSYWNKILEIDPEDANAKVALGKK